MHTHPPRPLTTLSILEFAELRFSKHRAQAAACVAEAETEPGTAGCNRFASAIDELQREAVAHGEVLADLLERLNDFAAADRIRAVRAATSSTLINFAYRCRMLSIPGWAPGRLAAQPADAEVAP